MPCRRAWRSGTTASACGTAAPSSATQRIKNVVDLVSRTLSAPDESGEYEPDLVTIATVVGSVVPARAVDDATPYEKVREATLNHLLCINRCDVG
jgi:hypothetical protein